MPGLGLGITARRGGLSPAIAASLPSLDLDFLKQGYQMSLIGKAFSEIFTFTRASGGGRINASGVYEWVAANQPRFDYDQVTLQPKGILIEEQRTNLLTHSNDFSATGWNGSNWSYLNRTPGAFSYAGLSFSAVALSQTGQPAYFGASTVSANAGESFTASILAAPKSVSNHYAISIRGTYPRRVDAIFNLSTGALVWSGGVTWTGLSAKSTNMGGGVWCLEITGTAPVTEPVNMLHGPCESSAQGAWEGGRAVLCDAYISAAQFEKGASRASHIPTSGSQVTRAVDIPTEQLPPWFKPGVGTVVWRGDVSAVPAGKWQGLFQFDDGSTANRLGAYVYPNGTLGLDRRIAGAMVNIATANSVTPGAQFKVACSWDSVNFYLSLNGGPVVSAAHGGLPTVNRLVHGKFDDYLNGHEAGFKYLPKTTIGAALQALSA